MWHKIEWEVVSARRNDTTVYIDDHKVECTVKCAEKPSNFSGSNTVLNLGARNSGDGGISDFVSGDVRALRIRNGDRETALSWQLDEGRGNVALDECHRVVGVIHNPAWQLTTFPPLTPAFKMRTGIEVTPVDDLNMYYFGEEDDDTSFELSQRSFAPVKASNAGLWFSFSLKSTSCDIGSIFTVLDEERNPAVSFTVNEGGSAGRAMREHGTHQLMISTYADRPEAEGLDVFQHIFHLCAMDILDGLWHDVTLQINARRPRDTIVKVDNHKRPLLYVATRKKLAPSKPPPVTDADGEDDAAARFTSVTSFGRLAPAAAGDGGMSARTSARPSRRESTTSNVSPSDTSHSPPSKKETLPLLPTTRQRRGSVAIPSFRNARRSPHPSMNTGGSASNSPARDASIPLGGGGPGTREGSPSATPAEERQRLVADFVNKEAPEIIDADSEDDDDELANANATAVPPLTPPDRRALSPASESGGSGAGDSVTSSTATRRGIMLPAVDCGPATVVEADGSGGNSPTVPSPSAPPARKRRQSVVAFADAGGGGGSFQPPPSLAPATAEPATKAQKGDDSPLLNVSPKAAQSRAAGGNRLRRNSTGLDLVSVVSRSQSSLSAFGEELAADASQGDALFEVEVALVRRPWMAVSIGKFGLRDAFTGALKNFAAGALGDQQPLLFIPLTESTDCLSTIPRDVAANNLKWELTVPPPSCMGMGVGSHITLGPLPTLNLERFEFKCQLRVSMPVTMVSDKQARSQCSSGSVSVVDNALTASVAKSDLRAQIRSDPRQCLVNIGRAGVAQFCVMFHEDARGRPAPGVIHVSLVDADFRRFDFDVEAEHSVFDGAWHALAVRILDARSNRAQVVIDTQTAVVRYGDCGSPAAFAELEEGGTIGAIVENLQPRCFAMGYIMNVQISALPQRRSSRSTTFGAFGSSIWGGEAELPSVTTSGGAPPLIHGKWDLRTGYGTVIRDSSGKRRHAFAVRPVWHSLIIGESQAARERKNRLAARARARRRLPSLMPADNALGLSSPDHCESSGTPQAIGTPELQPSKHRAITDRRDGNASPEAQPLGAFAAEDDGDTGSEQPLGGDSSDDENVIEDQRLEDALAVATLPQMNAKTPKASHMAWRRDTKVLFNLGGRKESIFDPTASKRPSDDGRKTGNSGKGGGAPGADSAKAGAARLRAQIAALEAELAHDSQPQGGDAAARSMDRSASLFDWSHGTGTSMAGADADVLSTASVEDETGYIPREATNLFPTARYLVSRWANNPNTKVAHDPMTNLVMMDKWPKAGWLAGSSACPHTLTAEFLRPITLFLISFILPKACRCTLEVHVSRGRAADELPKIVDDDETITGETSVARTLHLTRSTNRLVVVRFPSPYYHVRSVKVRFVRSALPVAIERMQIFGVAAFFDMQKKHSVVGVAAVTPSTSSMDSLATTPFGGMLMSPGGARGGVVGPASSSNCGSAQSMELGEGSGMSTNQTPSSHLPSVSRATISPAETHVLDDEAVQEYVRIANKSIADDESRFKRKMFLRMEEARRRHAKQGKTSNDTPKGGQQQSTSLFQSQTTKELVSMFYELDVDRTGFVSRHDFILLLRRLDPVGLMSDADIAAEVKAIGAATSERVSFDQFQIAMSRLARL